jgi:hypothetical protein
VRCCLSPPGSQTPHRSPEPNNRNYRSRRLVHSADPQTPPGRQSQWDGRSLVFGGITRMRSVNPAEVSRTAGLVCSPTRPRSPTWLRLATLPAARCWTTTVHAPPTHIQLFAIAVIKATFKIVVVSDIVNRVGVVFGPPTAMTAGQKSHDCQ